MSRYQRPLEAYFEAARQLTETFPSFAKYLDRADLSPQEKAAIARKKYEKREWKRRVKRDTRSYVESAKTLSKFVPSLKKYKRRKTLTAGQKSAIAKYENKLRYVKNLVPVNKKLAVKLKGKLYAPGVQAIELENTGEKIAIKIVKGDIFLTTNGRTWLYWSLDKFTQDNMETAGETVFKHLQEAFPLEKIAELARRAFESLKLQDVYLWTAHGRAGEGFRTLKEFVQWLYEEWSTYREPERWVRGLAIAL